MNCRERRIHFLSSLRTKAILAEEMLVAKIGRRDKAIQIEI
jgi:hypothetical protein